jgi:protein SCO1
MAAVLRRLYLAGAACALLALGACEAPPPPRQLTEVLLANPQQETLASSHGTLPLETLTGKVLLVSFGYTHCPDICPANLGANALAIARLTPAERERVRFVMVAVDPARDTPTALREYLAYFHPDMLGLSAQPETLAHIAQAFGAVYILGQPDANGAYSVDHSTQTWLLNARGELVRTLDFASDTDAVVAAIRSQL